MTGILTQINNFVSQRVTPALHKDAYGRQLLYLDQANSGGGLGQVNVDFLKYIATAEPIISYKLMKDIEDRAQFDLATVRPAKIQSEILITREQQDLIAAKGIDAMAPLLDDLFKGYALKESRMIVNGWSMSDTMGPDLLGIKNVFGTVIVGTPFATTGNAVKTVGAAIAAARAKGITSRAWNLTLNSKAFSDLDGSVYSSGIEEIEIVLKKLNQRSGNLAQIFEDTDLAEGEGFISPVALPENLAYCGYIESRKPLSNTYEQTPGSEKTALIVELTGAGVPYFMHLDKSTNKDNCVVKMTGI